MTFGSLKLKPSSGASRIKNTDDAYSFMMHLNLSYRNKPHWQMAWQTINLATASEASETHAWRVFRDAVKSEDWLEE